MKIDKRIALINGSLLRSKHNLFGGSHSIRRSEDMSKFGISAGQSDNVDPYSLFVRLLLQSLFPFLQSWENLHSWNFLRRSRGRHEALRPQFQPAALGPLPS